MNKQQIIDLMMLLSALESWSFSAGQRLPDYLIENLNATVEALNKELLK